MAITTFTHSPDFRSKISMRDFLKRHNCYGDPAARGHYAHNVRIPRLNLPDDLESRAYDLLENPFAFESIENLMHEFSTAHQGRYQATFEGRSGGQFVLLGLPALNSAQAIDELEFGELRQIAHLVDDFDRLTDECVSEFVYMCQVDDDPHPNRTGRGVLTS